MIEVVGSGLRPLSPKVSHHFGDVRSVEVPLFQQSPASGGRDHRARRRLSGATADAAIRRHLLPSFLSFLIVHLTLAVPNMILGETALSFIGLGLKVPVVSWGVLLTSAQKFRTVALSPWLLSRCCSWSPP